MLSGDVGTRNNQPLEIRLKFLCLPGEGEGERERQNEDEPCLLAPRQETQLVFKQETIVGQWQENRAIYEQLEPTHIFVFFYFIFLVIIGP